MYDKEFKKKVLTDLEKGAEIKALAKKYHINRSTIYDWRNQRDQIMIDPTIEIVTEAKNAAIDDIESALKLLRSEGVKRAQSTTDIARVAEAIIKAAALKARIQGDIVDRSESVTTKLDAKEVFQELLRRKRDF